MKIYFSILLIYNSSMNWRLIMLIFEK